MEDSEMTLYPYFFDFNVGGYTDAFAQALSPTEARALVYLHELKHAMGGRHDHPGEMEGWNDDIFNLCIGPRKAGH
jgi:hypothetical protein